MSKPKRGKSGDGAEGGPIGGGEWDHALTSCPFQEDSWTPCVTWVVGRQVEDLKHIEHLNTIVQTGTRRLFSVVTKDQLYTDVCDLGNPKNKKAKEIPANSEVCEACKPYLDNGDPIPPPLLAKLIKWKLMAIKTTDMKRRDLEAKAGSDKNKGKGKEEAKGRAKSPKKGGKKTPEPQQAKEGSKLRKRGEEDDGNKFIDDEPDDGAAHYIIVSGFHNPQIFQYLEEVGVAVSSIVGVASQDYTGLRIERAVDNIAEPDPEAIKEAELRKELNIFWKDLLPLLQRMPDSSTLHSIARLDYEVKKIVVPTDFNDAEQKVQYSTALFEDVAVMIYDLLDATRLYRTYLDNLKLVKVQAYGQEDIPIDPTTPQPPATPGTAKDAAIFDAPAEREKPPPPPVDMRFYNDLMNTVPQESASIPLIIHSMLEQVCATEEGIDPPSEQSAPARSDGLNFNLATYLSDVATRLGLTEKEHNLLTDVLELPKPPPDSPQPPELVNIQDGISIRTLHLKPHYGFDPAAVERAMLQFLPFANMCKTIRPTSSEGRQRAARLQELIHFCATDGLSKSEIDRAFKQFVFESMDLTTTDPNGFLIEKDKEGLSHTAIPWDDPYPYYKIMVPTIERESTNKTLDLGTPSEERSDTSSHLIHFDHTRKDSVLENNMKLYHETIGKGKKKGVSGAMLDIEVNLGLGACTPEPAAADKSSSRPGSADSKKGILVSKSPSQASSHLSPRRSRSNSVHWGAPVPLEEDPSSVAQGGPEASSISQSLMETVDAQKRCLDQWCFAEHFKPHILAQILSEASYHLPFCEMYHHKRDQSLMLVLHNPYSSELQNHIDWHKELHSNLGFRNYLEYTAESITEWLKEKEAEYQAQMLSKEVEGIVKEEEDKQKEADKPVKGKKSPRKSPSRSKSPKGSRSNSSERPGSASSNPYIRAGSLKAWQAEQDKIAQEEEEKEREKLAKRTRSAEKRAKEKETSKNKKNRKDSSGFSDEEEKEKSERSKSPRGSAKSRQSRAGTIDDTPKEPPSAEQVPQTPEKFWPFSGYDSGNQLLHVSGITTTLFPTDGGRIKTERTEFVQGNIAIRSVLQKDDHIFSVHVLNPREDMNLPEDYEMQLQQMAAGGVSEVAQVTEGQTDEIPSTAEKSETENTEKEEPSKGDTSDSGKSPEPEAKAMKTAVSQFGSVTAQLSDGMVLALSQFGAKGESYLKPYEPAIYTPPIEMATPSIPNVASSPSKGKADKGKKGQPTPEPEKMPEEEPMEEEKKDEEKPVPKQDFQELFVTCPDGLTVKYFLQSSVGVIPSSSEERQLAVKQSYPFKTKGVQECESARRKYMCTEVSRVITADGTVVKNMLDGSVEVLSADGTVSVYTGQWHNPASRSSSPARSVKSNDEGRNTPTAKKDNGNKPDIRVTRKKSDVHKHNIDVPKHNIDVPKHDISPAPESGRGSATKAGRGNKAAADQSEVEEELKLTTTHGNWVITYPSGERLQITKETGDCVELSSVPICVATDPDSMQTMATRDDHVITVSYPDGTTVVEHADGTRITVYYRESAQGGEGSDADSPTADLNTQTLKFVKVECPAFATVEFNTATSENLTVFGSGTSINVFPDGYYILHHSAGGRVEVDTEGTMVYFPRRSRFLEHLMPERELQYVMRHNADVIMETVDPDGNVFNVRSTGDFNVIPVQGDDAMSDDSEDNAAGKDKVTQYGQHAPRFFIIHSDGGGTELLRYQDVAEYLMMSEQNPATAVLKDSLPEHPGVTGITILKPYLSGLSERWFKKYDQESIVPQGIRCRDLKTLPSREYKRPGPQFGTNVGRGMNVGAAVKGPTRIPILKCPNKLELRQVVQYRPVADVLRDKLQAGLREYAEGVVSRLRTDSLMSVGDPRTEDEKILAEDLRNLAETQRAETKDCEPEHVKSVYEKAVSPPAPSPPPTPQPKRTLADWERDRRELEEENDAKSKLSNKIIEPYFESELGKAFLLTQASDMDDMMRQIADDQSRNNTVRDDTNSRLTYTQSPVYTQIIPPSNQGQSESGRSTTSESPATNNNHKNGQETPVSYVGGTRTAMSEAPTMTPSGGVRPHNPTPAHATGQGSPAPLRPTNPTPAHAGKVTTDRPDMDIKSTDRELSHHQALTTNVTGEPRSESVPLPTSIKGGRPGAVPNIKYRETEDPVRRQVKTSLIAGATTKGKQHLGMMRGLICQPEGVNFGVLKEGCTYAFVVTLRNTGVDTCRFKVRQPPPATGLGVVYKPGPVAAGMSVELHLELYAIANGVEGESGVGSLGHVLEVVTETDLLEVPVVATILTAHEYENPELSGGLRETNAKLISTRPPASTGIIRPRRAVVT